MSTQDMNNQKPASKPPAGIKAGNGKYYFDLGTADRIEAGPAYSTAAGPLVVGERIQCGLMRMPEGSGSRPHSHPNEQWVYILQGTMESETAGVKALCPPGTLHYIPANAIHTGVALPGKGDVVFFTCKDMSHGIWGNPVDTSTYGPRYAPGFERE